MQLYDNERLDKVNDSISLIQKTDGLTFGTDALLLCGYVKGKYKDAVELGGGSGIISMLLLSREKVERITALEVQEEYAELISRNAELNRLTDRLTSVCADARDYIHSGECDLVITNPPYMKEDSGKSCALSKKNIARHEIHGTIDDFLSASARLLKFGGCFAAVYRPDRLADLIYAMKKSGIEPKKMTLVHADSESEPSMLLIIGKKGAKSSMTLTSPFIIYKDREHRIYTEDMNYVMERGSFPDKYKR